MVPGSLEEAPTFPSVRNHFFLGQVSQSSRVQYLVDKEEFSYQFPIYKDVGTVGNRPDIQRPVRLVLQSRYSVIRSRNRFRLLVLGSNLCTGLFVLLCVGHQPPVIGRGDLGFQFLIKIRFGNQWNAQWYEVVFLDFEWLAVDLKPEPRCESRVFREQFY